MPQSNEIPLHELGELWAECSSEEERGLSGTIMRHKSGSFRWNGEKGKGGMPPESRK